MTKDKEKDAAWRTLMMDTIEVLKTVKTLSPDEIDKLLRSIKKKASPKPKKKGHVSFDLKVNKQRYQTTVNASDIVKHFMETLIPDVGIMSSHAVKSQIVSMFEMLAELEESKKLRDKWRQKASKVLQIDNQEHLFSYVATLATGIRV